MWIAEGMRQALMIVLTLELVTKEWSASKVIVASPSYVYARKLSQVTNNSSQYTLQLQLAMILIFNQ